MKPSETIHERISQLVDYFGNGKNTIFAKAMGESEANVRGYKTNVIPKQPFLEKIARTFDISSDWLLTGRGAMRRDEPAPIQPQQIFPLRSDRLIERQQIPIYDMDAVAGLVPLFTQDYTQQVVEVMETTLIPKCDGGLRIMGDSMYPLLKSGDVVFYKQIRDMVNNLFWGEMYLVSFDVDGDEFVTVKYINRSDQKDHIKLVSYNEHHAPLDIGLGRVRALALIKASLRLNSIK